MEENLRNLLVRWGTPAAYVKKLEDEEVFSVSTLLLMTPSMVESVFPKLGSRATFQSCLEDYRKALDEIILTIDDLKNIAKIIIEEHRFHGNDRRECDNKVIRECDNKDNREPDSKDNESCSSGSIFSENNGRTGNIESNIDFDDVEFESTIVNQDETSTSQIIHVIPSTQSAAVVVQASGLKESISVLDKNPNSTSVVAAAASACSSKEPASGKCPTKRSAEIFQPKHLNLKDLLKAGLKGKAVLHYFQENQNLNETQRNNLADLILGEYLKDYADRKLPDHDIEVLGNKVLELFPSECKAEWVPAANNREKGCGRGILLRRYYAMRRGFLKCGLLSKKPAMSSDRITINVGENDDDDDEDLLWLRNNRQPWSKVQEKWDVSFPKRWRKFKAKIQSIPSYFDAFPVLKDKAGFILLEGDYDRLYPDTGMSLYQNWPHFAAFVEKEVPLTVKEAIDACLTSEGKRIKTIQSLPYLFKVQTVARKKTKCFRPSRQEVAESLILHVKKESEINSNLAARMRDRYEPYGLKMTAQAVIVGDDEDAITKSFVRINATLYAVENPRKALDITFKIIHALDAIYPKESEREWLFLERAIYGINVQKPCDGTVKKLIESFNQFKKNE